MNSHSESYKNAGVDITAGYRAVELMKAHVARTAIPGVVDGIYNITCLVPMIGFALNGLILMTIYPLSKKKVEENAEILRVRHEDEEQN